jgi:ribonuclease D
MSDTILTAPGKKTGRDYSWIETDAQLHDLCSVLEQQIEEGTLHAAYIDTEADSLHHFQEKLCLIQLAAGDQYALIDPLAIREISPLLQFLERTDVWLHGADYDLTLLKRTYGWTPVRIFDTQIAARLTGHRAFGLAALVQHHCDVTLCKSSQKEDWSQRPLPAKMQDYAIDDVRYLPVLAERLMAELAAKNRVSWFDQSCDTLKADVLARQERDREEAWRISGSGRLHPRGLALLREIWFWRESMAREKDVPPFRVLNNQQMLIMAGDWEQEVQVHPPPRWRGKWKDTFEQALQRVQQSDPATWPQRPKKNTRRVTDLEKDRVEKLCKARDRKAEALGLEPALLGSRSLMEDLVFTPESEAASRLMAWQREVLGEALA